MSLTLSALPWIPFEPASWMIDDTVRALSPAGRAYLMDILCKMHLSGGGGYILNKRGEPMPTRMIEASLGIPPGIVEEIVGSTALEELSDSLFSAEAARMAEVQRKRRDKQIASGRKGAEIRKLNQRQGAL